MEGRHRAKQSSVKYFQQRRIANTVKLDVIVHVSTKISNANTDLEITQ